MRPGGEGHPRGRMRVGLEDALGPTRRSRRAPRRGRPGASSRPSPSSRPSSASPGPRSARRCARSRRRGSSVAPAARAPSSPDRPRITEQPRRELRRHRRDPLLGHGVRDDHGSLRIEAASADEAAAARPGPGRGRRGRSTGCGRRTAARSCSPATSCPLRLTGEDPRSSPRSSAARSTRSSSGSSAIAIHHGLATFRPRGPTVTSPTRLEVSTAGPCCSTSARSTSTRRDGPCSRHTSITWRTRSSSRWSGADPEGGTRDDERRARRCGSSA